MGVTTCDIHGMIGIGEACKHIIDNINKGVNEKCVLVRVRGVTGENSTGLVEAEGQLILYIPFCLRCFEDKKMSDKMKITDDIDNLKKITADFEIGQGCALCIERYWIENKVN